MMRVLATTKSKGKQMKEFLRDGVGRMRQERAKGLTQKQTQKANEEGTVARKMKRKWARRNMKGW
jgi:hypothetical protein